MLPVRKFIRWKEYDYSQSGYYFVTICTQNRKCIFTNTVGADRCVRPMDENVRPMDENVRPMDENVRPMDENVRPMDENVRPNVKLNVVGKMIDYWWNELPNHFKNIELDDYVIMPNHIHGIIIIKNNFDLNVCGRMDNDSGGRMDNDSGGRMDNDSGGRMDNDSGGWMDNDSGGRMGDDSGGWMGDDSDGRMGDDSDGRTHRSAPTITMNSTLGNIIQWFKTMSTNEYIRNVKIKQWPMFSKRLFQRNYYEKIIKTEKQYLIIKNYIKNNPINWKQDQLFQ